MMPTSKGASTTPRSLEQVLGAGAQVLDTGASLPDRTFLPETPASFLQQADPPPRRLSSVGPSYGGRLPTQGGGVAEAIRVETQEAKPPLSSPLRGGARADARVQGLPGLQVPMGTVT